MKDIKQLLTDYRPLEGGSFDQEAECVSVSGGHSCLSVTHLPVAAVPLHLWLEGHGDGLLGQLIS